MIHFTDATAPEATTLTATAPEATAPEATAPEATAPEATAPEATAPEATAQTATAPEATARTATAPEATARTATAREATARTATAPEATARTATAPEATARTATAPEATARTATAPEATAPEATAQTATAPEATARTATAPEATARTATAPEATARTATAPEATARTATAPAATARTATAPEATAPKTAGTKRPCDSNREMEPKLKQQCLKLLLGEKDWLEDTHMWVAMKLLKKQFPHMGGLQDTLLGSNQDYMGFAAVSSPFVQVLNTHSSHWVTVASPPSDITADVILYDSLCTGVTNPTKMQIAKLLMAEHSPIRCVIDASQVQTGTNDCGLFALAAATSICFKCPGSLKFDQPAMRSHFNSCMRKGIMTPFPTSATAVRRQPANKCVEIKIYCSCRLPDNEGERMVLCDRCLIWYHQTCQNIAKSVFSEREEEVWHCLACKRLDVVLVT